MKILIDMNLPKTWVGAFLAESIDAVHWSTIGKWNAPDHEILDYAKKNGFTLFTHDLDFGALLAANKYYLPSVIQIRTQDITPERNLRTIVSALTKFKAHISNGALISIDEYKARVRILPL
jgi:predicted nuclease of predicted toxin-antitoxin system